MGFATLTFWKGDVEIRTRWFYLSEVKAAEEQQLRRPDPWINPVRTRERVERGEGIRPKEEEK